MVDSISSAGIQGVKAGMSGIGQAAQNIAGVTARTTSTDSSGSLASSYSPAESAGSSPDTIVNVTESLIQLSKSESQVQASAKIVETGSDVLGMLLDVKA